MKRSGRPSYEIQRNRLIELRKSANLTQGQLADALYEKLGRSADARTRESSYQRIERHGDTSAKFAEAIAGVLAEKLGKTPAAVLDVLRGGAPQAPPDRLDALQAQLQRQLERGGNDTLVRALQGYHDEEKPVHELARRVATRLEIAHLEQSKDELDALAALTGWSVDELLQPIGHQGHWLLISRPFGTLRAEVVLGILGVLHKIEDEGGKWMDAWQESDAQVILSAGDHWFRVRIEHPLRPQRSLSFSFVRCAPSPAGLSWVKPTWWDRFWIDGLERWAWTHANRVTAFDRPPVPGHLRRLQLVVSSREVPEQPAQPLDERTFLKTLFVFQGSLDELPGEILAGFEREGDAHALVTDWASSGLWERLEPYLHGFPASWWRIGGHAGGIHVDLSVNLRDMAARGMGLEAMPFDGTKFVIELAEAGDGGELHPVPWRARDAEQVATKRLRPGLQQRQDEVAVGPARPPGLARA